ncbi:MATH domain and coiled-coil domain-containing protein [Cardamine amara subsp. amara]|uniref:MATH domain and coiled-coil domain-containing protein n=1 Tax=Cardamine amara subsp. amara TaxID=228776 RepID=A0ABD1A642_CARAN
MGKEVDNTFPWVIKNFSSSLQAEEIYSEQFVIGGCKWRLVAYPEVNNVGDYLSLSLYLEVCDCESLPSGWRRHAKINSHNFKVIDRYGFLIRIGRVRPSLSKTKAPPTKTTQ